MARLIDWESVCIVCLQKGENPCIFGEDNDSIVIADKIMKYSDIWIKRDTNQPNSICLQCLADLNVASKFRRNYEQSESIIKALLNTNHQEFQIKDLLRPRPTTVTPILDICIKDEVVDNNTIDDGPENTSCHVNRRIHRDKLNKSSEHTQSESLQKEISQTQENTNSNEINIKHEIVEDHLIGDSCDSGRTSCIGGDYGPVSQATNEEIVQESKGGIPKHHRARPKQSTRVSLKICEICNHDFTTQRNLDDHMRRHNNQRHFSCDHCDKAFVTRSELRRHVRVHTGEKPYKCQYCDLRFSHISVKENHESKHTGEKPFKCPACDKSFGSSQGLNCHLLIHNKSTCKEFRREKLFKKHANPPLNRVEVNNSSEHTQTKSMDKEIFQIQEDTNSNEINIKHKIVEDDLFGDNSDIRSTPCIDQEYGTDAEAANGEIDKQSTGVPLKICEICNRDFRKQSAFDVHMRRHNNDRRFSCNHCDKAFVTRSALRCHVRVHTGEKPYKCQYCDLRYSTNQNRQNHERKHTGDKPYKGPTCDQTFGYSQGLKCHLRLHNGENNFNCKECGKKFTRKELFQKHINLHLNRDELNKSSEHTQKESLEKEIFQIQENTNSNEINIKHKIVEDDLFGDNSDIRSTPCIDQEYGTAAEATNGEIHKQSTGVSLKICEICNRDFRKQSAFDVHMRRHNNERRFSCNHCDKAFVTRSALRCHVRVHTGEKPYKCQYCDLRFSTNEVKRSHESNHTGEKPFKCPTCDKSFGYSRSLSYHLRMHNKFSCKECGKEFRIKNLFQNHVNRHLNRNELNKSSEHTQKKSLETEICQIQENTNSNEITIKHEIVENELIGNNCDIESTPCVYVDNAPVSGARNGEIVQPSKDEIPKHPRVRPKQSTRVSLKICEICNQDFRDQTELDDHMRRHNNVRPFNCDHCDKAFVTRRDLRSHVRVHTGEKPYKCQYCDLRFSDMRVKNNHESKHTGEKPFKCPICDKSLGYSKGLKCHLRIHNKSTCKSFSRENVFKKHANRRLNRVEVNNSSERTQPKSLDKEIFQIQENTNSNEIIIKHEIVEDKLTGDNCDIESTSYIDVDNGPVSEATNGEILSLKICEVCNHGFRHQCELDIHMRRHNNERPFSCDHCDKGYVTRSGLRRHVRVHTGERPYKCQYCDLRFYSNEVKRSHESKHTGEKPFKCPTCNKSFGYSQGLKWHLRIHNKSTSPFTKEVGFEKHVAQHFAGNELDKSSEHEQKKRLEKEIGHMGNALSFEENKHQT